MPPVFSFDSSAFIQPFRRYYPRDVFPTFWATLENMIANGLIVATEVVLDELSEKDDDLTKWIETQTGLFMPIDDNCQANTKLVVTRFPRWVDIDSGKNNADPFVIALAMGNGLTVVSDENGGSAINPTIPFVCGQFGVKHLRLVEFMRAIKLVM